MSRDGTGLYSKPSGTTAVAGTTIQSAPYNTLADDIANALTDSVNKDGTKAFSGVQSMGTNRLTNLGDATAGGDAPRYEQATKANAAQAASVSGTGDAITVTMSPVWLSQPTGSRLRFTAAGANTITAPTLKIDSLTLKTIKKLNGLALSPGDIIGSGHICDVVYNGTDFILLNPGGSDNGFFSLADNGAAEGPTVSIDRNSASPAASDVMGGLVFLGRSSTGVSRAYARIRAVIKTATNAAEDGLLALRSVLAGAEDDRFFVGAGLYSKNATGGDKGIDTINASALYTGGEQIANYKRKALTETVTASTTLQVDDDLFFAIAASTVYAFSFDVMFITNATADFKFDLDSSAGLPPTQFSAAIDYIAPNGTARVSDVHTAVNTTVSITSAAGTIGHIKITGILVNDTSAGNLRLRWAQNTSDAGNTQVRRGSFLTWAVT